MAMYEKYIFIIPPDDNVGYDASSRFVYRGMYADIYEMCKRRQMVNLLCDGTHGKVTQEEIAEASSKAPRMWLFPQWLGTGVSAYALPDSQKGVGKLDAADTGYSTQYPSEIERVLFASGAEYVVFNDFIRHLTPEGFENFIDRDASLPDDWGQSANRTYSYDERIDEHHIDDGYPEDSPKPEDPEDEEPAQLDVKETRFSVPERAFFFAVTDAVLARPLKSVRCTDDNGRPITVYAPPYTPWIDPDGDNATGEADGHRYDLFYDRWNIINAYGKYASAFPLHTLYVFRFDYDPDEFTLEHQPSIQDINYVPDAMGYGIWLSILYFLPRLRTESSWWEDSDLHNAAIRNMPREVAGTLSDLYRPPYITPTIGVGLPLANGNQPEDGDITTFVPNFIFSQTLEHARMFLSLLDTMAVKVGCIKAEFSCSVTDDYTYHRKTTHYHEYNARDSWGSETTTESGWSSDNNEYIDTTNKEASAVGWNVFRVRDPEATNLDTGEALDGLSLNTSTGKGSSVSYSHTTTHEDHVTSIYEDTTVHQDGDTEVETVTSSSEYTDKVTKTRSLKFASTVEYITPVGVGSSGCNYHVKTNSHYRERSHSWGSDSDGDSYDRSRDSDDDPSLYPDTTEDYTREEPEDITPFIPDFMRPCIKSADLYLAVRGTAIGSGEESGTITDFWGETWTTEHHYERHDRTGTITHRGKQDATRTIIKLGSSGPDLRFHVNLNLKDLMDKAIPVDIDAVEYACDDTNTTNVSHTSESSHSEDGNYTEKGERQVIQTEGRNKSMTYNRHLSPEMFVVLHLDPDADVMPE